MILQLMKQKTWERRSRSTRKPSLREIGRRGWVSTRRARLLVLLDGVGAKECVDGAMME